MPCSCSRLSQSCIIDVFFLSKECHIGVTWMAYHYPVYALLVLRGCGVRIPWISCSRRMDSMLLFHGWRSLVSLMAWCCPKHFSGVSYGCVGFVPDGGRVRVQWDVMPLAHGCLPLSLCMSRTCPMGVCFSSPVDFLFPSCGFPGPIPRMSCSSLMGVFCLYHGCLVPVQWESFLSQHVVVLAHRGH